MARTSAMIAIITYAAMARMFYFLPDVTHAGLHGNPERGDGSAVKMGACMSAMEDEKRAPLLDPIESLSEIIFGLNAALTFTGSLSAASVGCEEIRTIVSAAIGQGSATPVPTLPP